MQQQLKKATASEDTMWRKIPEPQRPEQIAALAYAIWQARGCPDGTAAEDWFRAEQEIGGPKRIDEKAVESLDPAERSSDTEAADSSVLRFPAESELCQAAHAGD
jgi:hypothetical protein